MSGTAEGTEYHIAKNRVETLVDGIFAIAMTLLVLTITIKKPAAEDAPLVLPGTLLGLLPQIFIFVVAFIVLAVFWHEHHRQFHFIHAVNPALLWITIFMLMSIVLVPFSTDIAGDYPNVGSAVLLFHLNLFSVGVLYALHWKYTCATPQLCSTLPELQTKRIWSFEAAFIPASALLAAIISLVTPAGSLLVYLAAPAAWYFLYRHLLPRAASQS